MLGLTVVTGLIDAFSYLALGHVFVANMTGNVVFLAFSVAGASGFSIWASLLAIAAFALGALAGGQLASRLPKHRGWLLYGAATIEGVLVLGAFIVAEIVGRPYGGTGKGVLIVVLGAAMGVQNATARRLAVPDLTTTVLTLTITGVAADSRAAGGSDSKIGRRALSVISVVLGALIGAAFVRGAFPPLALCLAGAALVGIGLVCAVRSRTDAPWTEPR
jgi:uncharacterized membrane protein YoaK (UPF0700 family)